MSYSFDTMLAMLRMLDRGEAISRTYLSDRFGVTVRTIDRYIQSLKNADFPIAFDKERKSYRFENGYSLKAASFSPEESLVFGLAKDALKKSFGPRTETVLSAIEKKVGLRTSALPSFIVFSMDMQAPMVEQYFGLLSQAIPNCQRVKISYEALHSKEETCREVDPHYLFIKEGVWLLRGYCHLRKVMRTFALDQIKSLSVLDKYFVPQDVSPDEELSGTFGSIMDGPKVTVVLRFKKEFAPYIQRKKWHSSQQIKEFSDGGIEATFHVDGFTGIKPWIYRWLPHVEVVAPKELRDIVQKDLREALGTFKV